MQRLRAVVGGSTCRVRAATRLQIGLADGLCTGSMATHASVLRVRAAIAVTHRMATIRTIYM